MSAEVVLVVLGLRSLGMVRGWVRSGWMKRFSARRVAHARRMESFFALERKDFSAEGADFAGSKMEMYASTSGCGGDGSCLLLVSRG